MNLRHNKHMFPSLPARLLRLMSSAQILYKENINIFFLKGCVFVFSVIICVLLQLLNLLVLNVIFGVFEHSRLWNPLVPVLVPALVMDEVPGQGLVQTLPKALRTQALTALPSNFGLVGLVQYAW